MMFQGMLSVGFFMSEDDISGLSNGKAGVFHHGDGSSIGVQLLACVCIITWSGTIALVINAVSYVNGNWCIILNK